MSLWVRRCLGSAPRLAALALLLGAGCLARHAPLLPAPRATVVIVNPYAGVDWANDGAYRANLHTHTTQSDGRLPPHEVVDRYHALGYRILALTDHDRVTWPWTEFSRLDPRAEDRDPAALNMLDVPGAEASRHHHINTLFCVVPGRATEEETLAAVRAQGGLAVLNHPGREQWSDARLERLFRRHSELLGMEACNQRDRYPGDRDRWDRLLTRMPAGRPVWGFSNDDMHRTNELGVSWNVVWLPDLSLSALCSALRAGRTCFSYVATPGADAPTLRAVDVRDVPPRIAVTAAGHTQTVWISEGRAVATNDLLRLDRTSGLGRYVRARLDGTNGWTCTHPFYLR